MIRGRHEVWNVGILYTEIYLKLLYTFFLAHCIVNIRTRRWLTRRLTVK